MLTYQRVAGILKRAGFKQVSLGYRYHGHRTVLAPGFTVATAPKGGFMVSGLGERMFTAEYDALLGKYADALCAAGLDCHVEPIYGWVTVREGTGAKTISTETACNYAEIKLE